MLRCFLILLDYEFFLSKRVLLLFLFFVPSRTCFSYLFCGVIILFSEVLIFVLDGFRISLLI